MTDVQKISKDVIKLVRKTMDSSGLVVFPKEFEEGIIKLMKKYAMKDEKR